jgi:hypothetical protein
MFGALVLLACPPPAAVAEPLLRRDACTVPTYGDKPATTSSASGDDDDSSGDGSGKSEVDTTLYAPLPGSGCLSLNVWASAILTATDQSFAAQRIQAFQPTYQGQFKAGAQTTVATGWNVGGLFVGTNLVFVAGVILPGSGGYFKEASFRIDRLQAGYAKSYFDYWNVDDFANKIVTPQRRTGLVAIDIVKPMPWQVTLSFEQANIQPGLTALPPDLPVSLAPPDQSVSSAPDLVLRTRYTTDSLVFHGALAMRPNTPGRAPTAGFAATIGGQWVTKIGNVPHTLAGQVSIARDMPTYLGTPVDVGAVAAVVRPADETRGYSAVVSLKQDWTPKLYTAFYVSYLSLAFPIARPAAGAVNVTRAAANITYQTSNQTSIAVELGYARGAVSLPDRLTPFLDVSGRNVSLTVTASAWF